MRPYQRPWWLLVSKSATLNTTIQEESRPGERVFIARGEAAVQGLAWLTWGPVTALLVIFILTWVAATWQINQQPWATRGLFIAAFLSLPALVWVVTALVFSRLSAKYVQAERQAGAQECVIRLNPAQRALFYQTTGQVDAQRVAWAAIRQVKVTHTIGERSGKAWRLVLETDGGPIVLLNERLGTHAQKTDLAAEIETICH